MLRNTRVGLCCAIAASLALSACDNTEQTTAQAAPVRPVKMITVGAADAVQASRFPAIIGASQVSELSFQVAGKLQQLPVKEAQALSRGDLIGKLDQRDLQSALDEAKAQFKSAKADFQRAASLAKDDVIAANALEQRETEYEVSKAKLDRAEKALADSVLRAPFDGVVAKKFVEALQTVSAGQSIVNFMSVDSLEATIDLPASFLANVPKNDADGDHSQAFILLDAAPGQLIAAEFKEASLIADSASQTYAITFAFRPPENLLVFPGINATVELRMLNSSEGVRVAVPFDAVSNDGSNSYVWVVDAASMTVSKRVVNVEDGVGETLVVTHGLSAQDRIVGAGAAYLSEGMQVREWQ